MYWKLYSNPSKEHRFKIRPWSFFEPIGLFDVLQCLACAMNSLAHSITNWEGKWDNKTTLVITTKGWWWTWHSKVARTLTYVTPFGITNMFVHIPTYNQIYWNSIQYNVKGESEPSAGRSSTTSFSKKKRENSNDDFIPPNSFDWRAAIIFLLFHLLLWRRHLDGNRHTHKLY